MKDLLVIYGSSVFASMIYNAGIYYKVHRDARKKVMKKLKFDGDLSKYAKKELREINKDFALAILIGIKNSFVPFANVAFSLNTYECTDTIEEAFEEEYDYIVEKTNEKEDFARKVYLDTLRELSNSLEYRESINNLDDDIKNNLDDDQYRPSKKTYIRAVKSLVYGPKMK